MKFDAQILREMRDILIVAALLGLAYNRSSPLGFNNPVSPGAAASGAVAPSPSAATLQSLANPSLQNETISAVVVPIGPGSDEHPAAGKSPAVMAWPEVEPLLRKHQVLLVDAREKASYDAGHIPGAVSLPYHSLGVQIVQFVTRYPKDKPIVVYCESFQCTMAHAEAVALSGQYGYQDVREMPGGFAEWRTSGTSAIATMRLN